MIRSPITEIRDQRSVIRSQISDIRYQKSEIRAQRSERDIRDQKLGITEQNKYHKHKIWELSFCQCYTQGILQSRTLNALIYMPRAQFQFQFRLRERDQRPALASKNWRTCDSDKACWGVALVNATTYNKCMFYIKYTHKYIIYTYICLSAVKGLFGPVLRWRSTVILTAFSSLSYLFGK